jgi:ABC-type branched-subunit amino acid transport system substrate-binding protein
LVVGVLLAGGLLVGTPMGTWGAGAATATGAPVSVMTMADLAGSSEWPDAVRARVERINSRGGIRDETGTRHEVDLFVCDTKFDVSATAACAQRAVDEQVAAIVGMSVANGPAAWPVLEAAGIPVIGARINTESDVVSPVSYPVGSGVVGVFTAMPQLLGRRGAEKIGVIVSEFGDASRSAIELVGSGVTRAGATQGPVVRIPLGVTDVAPYVSEVTSGGVDGVVVFVAAPVQASVLEQLRTSGYKGRVVVPSSVADRIEVALGDEADGTLVVGEFLTPWTTKPNPGLRRFRSDGLAYGRQFTFDEGAINFWLAAWVFEHVAAGLPNITAPDVRAALDAQTDLDTGGLTPPFSGTGGSSGYPRLLNPTVSFSRIEGGIVAPLSRQLFDPLTASTR